MDYLLSKGCGVVSIGLFDDYASFFAFIKSLLCPSVIVSSNLRSNIFFLLFPFKKGVIILNGLGRYRDIGFFRKMLIMLLRLNLRSKYVIVQNYADWRYMKRYVAKSENLMWFPGSGGSKRSVKKNDYSFFVVQRKEKFKCVVDDLIEFACLGHVRKINVVGCNTQELQLFIDSENVSFSAVGYQDQDEIFYFGVNFIQPYGYGEGFPHTLADAILSGLNVYISSKLYVQLGLYKMDSISIDERYGSEWIKIQYGEKAKNIVGFSGANKFYYSVINKLFEPEIYDK